MGVGTHLEARGPWGAPARAASGWPVAPVRPVGNECVPAIQLHRAIGIGRDTAFLHREAVAYGGLDLAPNGGAQHSASDERKPTCISMTVRDSGETLVHKERNSEGVSRKPLAWGSESDALLLAPTSFSHEAFLYRDEDEFLGVLLPFIGAGVKAGERVLVVMSRAKNQLLEWKLGATGARVRFVDVATVGLNPGRCISRWNQFVRDSVSAGYGFRGVGEPAFVGRGGAELDECWRHETLLNTVFDAGPPWRLLCPYDTERSGAAALAYASRTHPHLRTSDGHLVPAAGAAPVRAQDVLAGSLPAPPVDAAQLRFSVPPFDDLLGAVEAASQHFTVDRRRALVAAVGELAANSYRHGGGAGSCRIWSESDDLVVEVSDRGKIEDPLVGRLPTEGGGGGLWRVHQLCDLVQLRSSSQGTVVRLTMRPMAPSIAALARAWSAVHESLEVDLWRRLSPSSRDFLLSLRPEALAAVLADGGGSEASQADDPGEDRERALSLEVADTWRDVIRGCLGEVDSRLQRELAQILARAGSA